MGIFGSGRRKRGPALGDEAGLRAAYDAHGAEIYRMALRALGDPGLAEEAVQETFVRAWRASDRYDPERGSLRTWMFAVGRNVTLDMARARSVRPQTDGSGVEHARSEEPIENVLRSWEIEEGLQRISADHRRAIVEVYYSGKSSAEVAAELGVPEGTVRSRLFYGLKSLRLALEEIGWTG